MQLIGIRSFADGATIVEDRALFSLFYRRNPNSLTYMVPFEVSGTEYLLSKNVRVIAGKGADPEPLPGPQCGLVISEILRQLTTIGIDAGAEY